MSSWVQGFVQGLAQDYATDKWNDYAEAKFQPTKDPFYEKTANGKSKRRKLPDFCSQREKKLWKKLQNRAWKDDRCLCGCLWVNWGLGLAPVLSIIPTIGPIIMYMVHSKLISMADKELSLPADVLAKLHGNIVLDLLISLPPLLGTLLAWLNACSTRNCALIYNYMAKNAIKKHNAMVQQTQVYPGPASMPSSGPITHQKTYAYKPEYQSSRPTPPPLAATGMPLDTRAQKVPRTASQPMSSRPAPRSVW
ncbi:LAQU0S07e02410g1_1 [Lachancea quebecensis]|uniref:LAQU0S07e02410g1_1 n=1 Tax=Lachancea quebecensis TaxID=1654605 RepID=A0A0P1KSE1_9SACH|nr:LAQU0S07e02410g1_1 [Lachancea quebecensis]